METNPIITTFFNAMADHLTPIILERIRVQVALDATFKDKAPVPATEQVTDARIEQIFHRYVERHALTSGEEVREMLRQFPIEADEIEGLEDLIKDTVADIDLEIHADDISGLDRHTKNIIEGSDYEIDADVIEGLDRKVKEVMEDTNVAASQVEGLENEVDRILKEKIAGSTVKIELN